MTVEKFSKLDIAFMKDTKVGLISTITPDNYPHVTPVYFVVDEDSGEIYFETLMNSIKLRNLIENPRVTFYLDNGAFRWTRDKAMMIQGYAEFLSMDNRNDIAKFFDLMAKKYPEEFSKPDEDVLEYLAIIKIKPTKIIKSEPLKNSSSLNLS